MFFVYPAAVSQNCDRKIVAPACKAMERFFLTQIEDAFSSGILRAKQVYNPAKEVYSPIMLEAKRNTSSKMLIKEDSDPLTQLNDDLLDLPHLRYSPSMTKYEISENIKQLKQLKRQLQRYLSLGNGSYDDALDTVNMYLKEYEKEEKGSTKTLTSTGSYRPLDSKIDIIPTSGVIRVPIQYIEGPNDGAEKDRDVTVGVKVIPFIMKNFKDVETALLDDYFSKVSESAFKMLTRKIGRSLFNVYHRIISKIPGISYVLDAKVSNDQDDVKDTVLGASGFVNASAFRSNRNSPANYKFTSNVVIFNKDDLSDPDDYNIFSNRSAMNRLFRMGWSTFGVLDSINEEMTFISSLDGGYMHVIPYSYMFETIGSKVLYDSSDKLKRASSPFNIRKGNFRTFSNHFSD